MRSISTVLFLFVVTVAGVSRADTPIFRGNIEELTEENTDFRRVLFTGDNVQVVAMSLKPGEDIGQEVHKVDQCFFFVDGKARTIIQGKHSSIAEDDVLCIPAGTPHNIINTSGREDLKIYTTYSPPQHPAGTVTKTKADAVKEEGGGKE